MEDKRFGQAFLGLCYGLVRVSPDMKLIDYNSAAKRLVPLPRRGADITPLLVRSLPRLDKLGEESGSIMTQGFCYGSRRVNFLAFREESGSVLCLIHPLFAAIGIGNEGAWLSRVAKYYCKSIFALLEEADNIGGRGVFRTAALSDKVYIKRPNNRMNVTLLDGIKIVANKLVNTKYYKYIDMKFDLPLEGDTLIIEFNIIDYAITEMLAVCEIFARGNKTVLRICGDKRGMTVALTARVAGSPTESDICFLKIFNEIMKIMNVDCDIRLASDGRFTIDLIIPGEYDIRYLKDPTPFEWQYIDYALDGYWSAMPLPEDAGWDDEEL